MRPLIPALATMIVLSACAPAPSPETDSLLPTQTVPPPSPSPFPTDTLVPTATALPPTPTPVPQVLLLRRRCGRDDVVRADEPIRLFYGGWGVAGSDLADQWSRALVVDLTIDDVPLPGELQRPANELPLNCMAARGDLYWLYYSTLLPGPSAGVHHNTVAIASLRPLPDGSGPTFGPGTILEQTFTITGN
jgi:hypothetical protein